MPEHPVVDHCQDGRYSHLQDPLFWPCTADGASLKLVSQFANKTASEQTLSLNIKYQGASTRILVWLGVIVAPGAFVLLASDMLVNRVAGMPLTRQVNAPVRFR